MEINNLLIGGSGVAGLTAALYAARNSLNPLVFAGSSPGGLLAQTGEVENYPGFPEGIRGADLMDMFQKQAERFGAKVLFETIVKAELTDGGIQTLIAESGKSYSGKALIVATGCLPRWLGLPSEKEFYGRGVSACAFCDGPFFRNKTVCVVGGGDTAMEDSLLLAKFAEKVHLIHRRDSFRASRILQDQVKKHPSIEIHYNTVVEEILGKDVVERIRIRNLKTEEISEIAVSGYFAALGHIPNTDLFKGQLAMDDSGYIQIACNTTESSLKGVFACGDCIDSKYRQAVTAAGSGCKAAIDAARYLMEQVQ